MVDPSKDSKLSTGIDYGICSTFRGGHRCQIARNRWSMYGEKDQYVWYAKKELMQINSKEQINLYVVNRCIFLLKRQ